jgi:hypothetical protein
LIRDLATLVLALALALSPAVAAQDGCCPVDTKVQARIDVLVRSIAAHNRGEPLGDIESGAAALLESTDGDRERLLRQLAIHRAGHPGNESAMSGALLLHHFEFTPAEMRQALVPLLESPEASLVATASDLLRSVDDARDLSPYGPVLRDGEGTPHGLAVYLYSLSPPEAFRAFSKSLDEPERADVARRAAPTLAALEETSDTNTHDTADAIRLSLDRLSLDSHFWVRMLAATYLREHPHAATTDTLTRLRSDPDAPVRKSLALHKN